MPHANHTTEPKALKYVWLDAVMSPQGPASPMTRYVLQTMARWCSRQLDHFWVAQTTLVEQTGLGEATVRRHIRDAIDTGWLDLLERGRSSGRRNEGFASTYQLRLPIRETGSSIEPVHQPITATGNQADSAEQPINQFSRSDHSDRPHRDTLSTSRNSFSLMEGSPSERPVDQETVSNPATSDGDQSDQHLRALNLMERAVAIGNQEEVTHEDLAELQCIAEAGGRAAAIAKAQLRNIEGRESC